jgi:hypothetical protein
MPAVARVVAVVAAPIALAAAGVAHPRPLSVSSASGWADLHVVLLPVFPLVALGFVVPLWGRPRRDPVGAATVLAWVAGFTYACFYTGLDAVAGIAAGRALQHAPAPVDRDAVVGPLFAAGDQLGRVGAYAFLVAAVAACVALYPRAGIRILPAGAVLFVAGWSFVDSHIFWPRGVLTMLGFALGFALLVWAADTGSKTGRRRMRTAPRH